MRLRAECARVVLTVGLLLAVVAVTAVPAFPASAQASPPGTPAAAGSEYSAAALPTCTHFSQDFFNGGRNFIRFPTVGAGTRNSQCKLELGDYNNWGVVALQQWLQHCNNAPQVAVDGDYGPITRDVITWIQAVKGIRIDGVYGPQTMSVLSWAEYDLAGRFTGCS